MKKLISLLIFFVGCTNLFGQIETGDDKPVCSVFDPAMWESAYRAPLRDELISLAGDLKDKSVLDIGAGSGFFTFGFAGKANRVVATELDNRFLEYIDQKEQRLGLTNIETRQADNKQSELNNLENVDVAVMVLVYHFLEDPGDFLTKVKSSMKKGGKIIIVNGEGFSPRFITDYLKTTGFRQVSLKKFTLTGGSCGTETFNIVSAVNL